MRNIMMILWGVVILIALVLASSFVHACQPPFESSMFIETIPFPDESISTYV